MIHTPAAARARQEKMEAHRRNMRGGDETSVASPRERPILFQGRLVRAILRADAPKTQTRRIVTDLRVMPRREVTSDPLPWQTPADLLRIAPPKRFLARLNPQGAVSAIVGDQLLGLKPGEFDFVCPYATGRTYLDERRWRIDVEPGQRLWVRESWRSWERKCQGDHEDDEDECTEHCHQVYVAYQATPRTGYRPTPDRARITYLDEATPLESDQELLGPWKPSIHMPRWASRLELEVASVRLERLQDITEADAIAEGVKIPDAATARQDTVDTAGMTPYRAAFAALWDSINAERAPWASNPWLWVITFARVP